MKNASSSTSEGALIFILGMIFGAGIAFLMFEYGNRTAQKVQNNIGNPYIKPDPDPTKPSGNPPSPAYVEGITIPGKARKTS